MEPRTCRGGARVRIAAAGAVLSLLALAAAPHVSAAPPTAAPGTEGGDGIVEAPTLRDQEAEATAGAAELTAFGRTVALGRSRTTWSPLGLDVEGVGAVVADTLHGRAATSMPADAADGTSTDGPTCANLALVSLPSVTLSTACGTASATKDGGKISAGGTGHLAEIVVDPGGPLATLDIGELLVGGAEAAEVTALLGPAAGSTDPVPDETVAHLLEQVLDGGGLVRVDLGAAESGVSSTAASLTARAATTPTEIVLLDRGDLGPAVTITVGEAVAEVTNTAGAPLEHRAVPAVVQLAVAEDLAGPLGVAATSVITPGQTTCIPLPVLGDACVSVAAGSSGPVDGGAAAETGAVSVSAFDALPDGGLVLHLGGGRAVALGTPSLPGPTPEAVPARKPTLPLTGWAPGWLPVALLGAALGAAAVRRLSGPDPT